MQKPYTRDGPNIEGKEFEVGSSEWDKPIFSAYHGTHLVGSMLAEGPTEVKLDGTFDSEGLVEGAVEG